MNTYTMKLKNYATSLDEMIPDLTKEVAVQKGKVIRKDVTNALFCAGAAALCASQAVYHTSELTAIASKTAVKKVAKTAGSYIMSVYEQNTVPVVRR